MAKGNSKPPVEAVVAEPVALQGAPSLRLVVSLAQASERALAENRMHDHAALHELVVRAGDLLAKARAVQGVLSGTDEAIVAALIESL